MVQLVLHNLKIFYPLAGHDLSGNKQQSCLSIPNQHIKIRNVLNCMPMW